MADGNRFRLGRLVDRGDITITADLADGRGKNAQLTTAGRRRLEAIAPTHVADVRRVIFDHLDESETAALAGALSKVAGTLCDREDFLPERL